MQVLETESCQRCTTQYVRCPRNLKIRRSVPTLLRNVRSKIRPAQHQHQIKCEKTDARLEIAFKTSVSVNFVSKKVISLLTDAFSSFLNLKLISGNTTAVNEQQFDVVGWDRSIRDALSLYKSQNDMIQLGCKSVALLWT